MKITVVGAGYVGLVSGACLADFGHTVACFDADARKRVTLRNDEIPIYEPGLAALVASNTQSGRLSFPETLAEAMAGAEAVFIAVGTPSRRGDGHADLSYVYQAARDIAATLCQFTVIINKSTVPVGTGDTVESIIREANPAADFAVVSNPEFLREGAAIDDFKRPDRIVVGLGADERARTAMAEIYRPLFLNQSPILWTSRRSAELIKYAANAFLATKITFINEIADLCEALGADVQDVARGIGMDGRIGAKFLHPGPGYGGSCFPKDTLALVKTARDIGSPVSIVEQVVEVNRLRPYSMAHRIAEVLTGGDDLSGYRIALLGLAFKPQTDDMRESPSLPIIETLLSYGATLVVHDPVAMANAKTMLASHRRADSIIWAEDPYVAATDADVMVIVTEWNEYRALDLARVKTLLRRPMVIDLRNIYMPDDMYARGFVYLSIGRVPVEPEVAPR